MSWKRGSLFKTRVGDQGWDKHQQHLLWHVGAPPFAIIVRAFSFYNCSATTTANIMHDRQCKRHLPELDWWSLSSSRTSALAEIRLLSVASAARTWPRRSSTGPCCRQTSGANIIKLSFFLITDAPQNKLERLSFVKLERFSVVSLLA